MSSLEFNKMIWIFKNPQNIWVVRDTDNYLVQLPHFRDEVDTSQTPRPLRDKSDMPSSQWHVQNLNPGPKTNLSYIPHRCHWSLP